MNQSTNFGLKTTGDNDQWRDTLDYHNENMGKIDSVLDANQDALGIVVDGNKSALGASSGQYIILRNSTISGKADGLYTAAKAIPANTAIDGTYLTAVPGGGLNALNSNIASVQSELGKFRFVHEQYCPNENYIDIDFSDSKFVSTGVFMVTLNLTIAFITKLSDGIHLLGVLTPSDYSHLTTVTGYKLTIFSGQWYRWARVYQINIGSN